jgi:hypothetical protein
MAAGRPFQAEMEADVHQIGDEAVVPNFYTRLRNIRSCFPPGLFGFQQIFKVARRQTPPFPSFDLQSILNVSLIGQTRHCETLYAWLFLESSTLKREVHECVDSRFCCLLLSLDSASQ